MKRFINLLILCLITCICVYAEDDDSYTQRQAVTLGISFPNAFESGQVNGWPATSIMNGTGFDFNLLQARDDLIVGSVTNFSLGFPQKISVTSQNVTTTVTASDYDILMDIETSIALLFLPAHTKMFTFGVGPAFAFTSTIAKTHNIALASYIFGAGINMTGTFAISDYFGFTFGLNGLCNFYSINFNNVTQTITYDNLKQFALTPYVGISFLRSKRF